MEKKKKDKKKTYLLVGLGVVVLSAGAATWYFMNRNKGTSSSDDLDFLAEKDRSEFTLPQLPTPPSSSSQPKSNRTEKVASHDFPIQRGSSGKLVKRIQLALIKKYGKGILPKWGADGIWGSELENALRSKNFPTVITQNLYNNFAGRLAQASNRLAGIKGQDQLISNSRSRVWNRNGASMMIEANTILGIPISQSMGVTLFKTLDGNELFINSKNASYV